MDFALCLGMFILGATAGSLLTHAWMSDRHPMDLHSGPDNVETRARRVN